MHKILVIGGYGVFGRRICERLARISNIEIIITGRSIKDAEHLAAYLANAKCQISTLELDVHNIQARHIEKSNIFALINACGPFHKQNYALADLCIELGIHYIDLSDNRDFVAGIGTLDQAARKANVLVVSGASTVPAVSSAVIDHFQKDFCKVQSLDYGVTPGNQTDRGVGTVAAILSYVGKPFKTIEDGQVKTVFGWQNLHKEHYPVIGKRWMSNCDIPDLDLFQSHYPTLKTIRFYAGLQLSILHVGLWILSWPCRWRWIKSLDRYANFMRCVSLWFYNLGSDKGGMHIKIKGKNEQGIVVDKEWYLIASHGDGPYIPAAPAVILIKKLLDNKLDKRGAMPCMGVFSLDEFSSEISDLNIRSYTNETLYKRYLQERYNTLPLAVQKLHNYTGEITYTGQCYVIRGCNAFCRFIAVLLSLPPEGKNHPLKVNFKQNGGVEHWTRYFGNKTFYSKQWDQDGILYEKINITTLAFEINANENSLNLILKQVYAFGLPVGRLFKPKVIAQESQENDNFIVNVEVHLPFFGLLVKYDGWLSVEGESRS